MLCEDEVLSIRKKLEKLTVEGADQSRALDLLNALGKLEMSLRVLTSTKIGWTVNDLRKASQDKEVATLAKSLLKNWKKLAPDGDKKEKPKEECKLKTCQVKTPWTPVKTKSTGIDSMFASERQECGESVIDFKKSQLRARSRVVCGNAGTLLRQCRGVLYWMWRDKRVQDNWALLYSQKTALELNVPLHVAVAVPPRLGQMTIRHYSFMLEGLREVAEECRSLNIVFHLLAGSPPDVITPAFLAGHDIGLVVADFSPLREHRGWLDQLAGSAEAEGVALHQVDAHNIVPVWVTSDKQEYAARTIRPKITNKLPEFLTQFPPVIKHPVEYKKEAVEKPDFAAVYGSLSVDTKGWGVEPVESFTPGTTAGHENLAAFVAKRIKDFADRRNDPTVAALSNMSPWVNMGQVSAQRAVLYVKKHGKSHSGSVASYVEEAVVRRELSDNFCYHNENYDSVAGAADWARKTLADHSGDKREYVYTRRQLEEGKTHDDLWNAAQLQLVKEGKMHGFMRMYWAKKVLEWTESPEVALEEALRLNDRFALDGNDPNGFVGVMWSICGIHDQGWAERPVFGKIRYMNYAGCKRKFDIRQFIRKYGGKVYSSKK